MQKKDFKEKLSKQNKLKGFSVFIAGKMRQKIDVEGLSGLDIELSRVSCVKKGDIYTRRDLLERLENIACCASLLELRKYDTGEIIIHNANFCHNPVVCPICSDRVSKRRRAIFSDPIRRAASRFSVEENGERWKNDYPAGYTGVYLATATIKSGPDLRDRIDTLLNSMKKMRLYGQKRRAGRSQGEFSKVRAGLSNVEIKSGSGSGQWHVHAHYLLFTDSPINYKLSGSPYIVPKENGENMTVSKFNYEWYKATGGQGINFDLEPVKFRKIVHGHECKDFAESITAQAQEVLKYSTILSDKKGTDVLSAAQYVELIQRRGNRRLFNTLGLLRADKRNPDSFSTITERELKRREYIEAIDKKCYEIYSAQWLKKKYGRIKKQERQIFSNSDDINTIPGNIRRKAFQAQTAIYQGEYRRERHAILKARVNFLDENIFQEILNGYRDRFKNRVSSLWANYNDINFVPEFLTDFNSPSISEKYLKAA